MERGSVRLNKREFLMCSGAGETDGQPADWQRCSLQDLQRNAAQKVQKTSAGHSTQAQRKRERLMSNLYSSVRFKPGDQAAAIQNYVEYYNVVLQSDQIQDTQIQFLTWSNVMPF